MQKYVIIVESHDLAEPVDEVLVIEASSVNEAYRKAHAYFKEKRPEIWSDDWHHLRTDCENGDQLCYGPITVTDLS